jgi:hypothetical protein
MLEVEESAVDNVQSNLYVMSVSVDITLCVSCECVYVRYSPNKLSLHIIGMGGSGPRKISIADYWRLGFVSSMALSIVALVHAMIPRAIVVMLPHLI